MSEYIPEYGKWILRELILELTDTSMLGLGIVFYLQPSGLKAIYI